MIIEMVSKYLPRVFYALCVNAGEGAREWDIDIEKEEGIFDRIFSYKKTMTLFYYHLPFMFYDSQKMSS